MAGGDKLASRPAASPNNRSIRGEVIEAPSIIGRQLPRVAFLLNAHVPVLSDALYRDAGMRGYLFSPENTSAALARQLARRHGRYLLADDGLFGDIAQIVARATSTARQAPDLLAEVRNLAAGVDAAFRRAEQLATRPDAVIGPEDVTVAAWLRAGIAEKELRLRRREIRKLNSHVADSVRQVAADLHPIEVLAVASAHDYDTARDASTAFAAAGIRHCAIGIGAFMADNSWVGEVKIGGRSRRLPHPLPMRYIRSALVLRGFSDGWSQAGATPPEHVHLLGLGAPIMLPLAALALRTAGHVTFDATSPITGAIQGVLNVSEPAPLTVRMTKVVDAMLRQGRADWNCPCPFCGSYLAEHPFQPETSVRPSAAPVTLADLYSTRRRGKQFPLFQVGVGEDARAAEAARVGHNHWVLGQLTASLSTAKDLDAIVKSQVRRYCAAGVPTSAEAVSRAYVTIREPDPIVALTGPSTFP
jgi:hypothetical protein